MKIKHIANATAPLLFVVILALVLTDTSRAQQRMRMSPEERAAVLKDSLSLDSTQTSKIVAIIKERQDEMQKIREANKGDFQAMRPAMQELGKKTDDKILAVLNDTQKAKYQEMMKNRPMGRMGGRRGN